MVRDDRGTCLDLALLAASVLENFQQNPVLVNIKTGPHSEHSLLGCRLGDWPFFEAAIKDPNAEQESRFLDWALSKDAIIFDPLGFTRSEKYTCFFGDSVKLARRYLKSHLAVSLILDFEKAWNISPPISFRSNWPLVEQGWKAGYHLYRLFDSPKP